MTKTIQTIDISNLTSVTGGAHASVNVSELMAALSGGPKTKDAAKFIRALGSVGVR